VTSSHSCLGVSQRVSLRTRAPYAHFTPPMEQFLECLLGSTLIGMLDVNKQHLRTAPRVLHQELRSLRPRLTSTRHATQLRCGTHTASASSPWVRISVNSFLSCSAARRTPPNEVHVILVSRKSKELAFVSVAQLVRWLALSAED
jgi:hypothetical protein